MTPSLEITILGCATSTGVPVIGCSCPVCISTDPCNRRSRASLHVTTPEAGFLVDAGPDLRQQCLEHGVARVDAVFYTHGHLDHVAGFDELRAFCWHREDKLPLYGNSETIKILHSMFGWAFLPENTHRGYVRPEAIEFDGPVEFGGITITALPVDHGSVETHGLRIDLPSGTRIGYFPDVKRFPEETLEQLRDLDTLIIDGLRHEPHPTHMSVAEALETIELLQPRQAYLTHLSHDLDYTELANSLPAGILPAHDGLKLSFS